MLLCIPSPPPLTTKWRAVGGQEWGVGVGGGGGWGYTEVSLCVCPFFQSVRRQRRGTADADFNNTPPLPLALPSPNGGSPGPSRFHLFQHGVGQNIAWYSALRLLPRLLSTQFLPSIKKKDTFKFTHPPPPQPPPKKTKTKQTKRTNETQQHPRSQIKSLRPKTIIMSILNNELLRIVLVV